MKYIQKIIASGYLLITLLIPFAGNVWTTEKNNLLFPLVGFPQ